MASPRDYAHEHAQQFRDQLFNLIRIPSISTEPEHKADVRRAAEWIAADLTRIGARNATLLETGGHPVVYADWLDAGADAPTVLIYGHYDVQPATLADGWTSEPFEPVTRDGLMYARGISDDKGQMFIHLKALESYLATVGKVPVNVKFMLEGEEEVGSIHLGSFIHSHRERFKADVCLISDTGMRNIDHPAIVYALRGLTYMQLDVWGPNKDLHSGGYGGMVHNPALALAQIISKLHNPDNSIAVPGFYDDVLALTDAERAELATQNIAEETLRQATGIPESWGEAAFTLRERIGARPTMEINGLLSGWTGEGSKTVLPAKAMAKISCRLVANQDPHKIYELVKAYIASITPPTVHAELSLVGHPAPASHVAIDTPEMQAAVRAYEQGWGNKPIFAREGGSIPVVGDFKTELGLPSILMGFGLNTDGAHGPDEHFAVDMFHRGIDTAIVFLDELAKVK